MDTAATTSHSQCPICNKDFPSDQIEVHVNRCIFLNATDDKPIITSPTNSQQVEKKRNFQLFDRSPAEVKRPKLDTNKSKIKGTTTTTKRIKSATKFASSETVNLLDECSSDGETELVIYI